MEQWEHVEPTSTWSDPHSVCVMGCESSRSVEVENTITKKTDHKELRALLTDLQVFNTHTLDLLNFYHP